MSKRKRKLPDKGTWGRRILRSFIKDGRRWEYHVTKGWRSYRV